jgi:hypothetical protein
MQDYRHERHYICTILSKTMKSIIIQYNQEYFHLQILKLQFRWVWNEKYLYPLGFRFSSGKWLLCRHKHNPILYKPIPKQRKCYPKEWKKIYTSTDDSSTHCCATHWLSDWHTSLNWFVAKNAKIPTFIWRIPVKFVIVVKVRSRVRPKIIIVKIAILNISWRRSVARHFDCGVYFPYALKKHRSKLPVKQRVRTCRWCVVLFLVANECVMTFISKYIAKHFCQNIKLN